MKHGFFVCSLVCALLAYGTVAGQYVLTTDCGQDVPVGGTFDVPILFDSSAGADVQGWSFGVCQAEVEVQSVADGSTTATVNMGGPPDFNQVNILPNGWTVGVVISFTGMDVLPPGSGYELNVATYLATGAEGATYDICFCDTLGSPPVATVVVVSGQSIVPGQNCCAGTLVVDPLIFNYIAPTLEVEYNGNGAGTASADVAVAIQEDPASSGFPNDTQGYSMGLAHDETRLTVTALNLAPVLADLNGGAGPDFVGPTLLPNGWTAGVVYSFTGMAVVVFDVAKDVLIASYDASGLATGCPDVAGMVTNQALVWTETLGSPPVANVVVVAGQSISAGPNTDGRINFVAKCDAEFIRGDCNEDGIVNIADAVFILNFLFQGGPASNCEESCDANDDGLQDSSDSAYILNYRFLGGPPPSAPFPACGTEPGAPCDSHAACP